MVLKEEKGMENERTLNYRIGLDIGIASVGWAVLENNSKDEPIRIVDLGVRIFDAAEVPKTGASLAAPRREARTSRRRLRRRKHRLDRIKWLLEQEGMINIEAFMKRYESANLPDVYELRYEALERKLKNDELAQVLIHIAKHRGFRSTRKAELKDKETGAVLSATEDNKKRMEEKGYRTVGEMIYKDETFRTSCPWNERGYVLTPRNTAGDYKHTMLRALLEEEIKIIFECQRKYGNEKATEELEKKYLEIMLSQRSFDMGPGNQTNGKPSPYAMEGFGKKVGLCSLEPRENGEIRGAKATYTAELFVVLQRINNLRIVEKGGKGRELSSEERQILLDFVHEQKEITYAKVRKKLAIEETYRFNGLNYSGKGDNEAEKIKETEKAKFISMPWYQEYKKCMNGVLDEYSKKEQEELLDYVGTVLTLYKNDDTRTRELKKKDLSDEVIERLLELNPTKFQHISLKAMKKILPHLEEGYVYSEACEKAGYNHTGNATGKKSKLLKGKEIVDIVNDINNPVVKRSVSQTVKVINAIIQKYGSPQAINIELAREMSKNHDERKKMETQMDERRKENEKAIAEIQKKNVLSPTGQDIIKWRLWKDQGEYCMYSGDHISINELFTGAYDIDHILPYSITFDDSYRNKVLVKASENRQKGNRTPYEYFSTDKKKWSDFEVRVNHIKDYRKQQKLLKQHLTDEDINQFKARNLNDTRYISRVILNMINENLELAPLNLKGKKKQVLAVNGAITGTMRKRWGLPKKNRSTDTHHAMDAVVIACCTDGMIQKITKAYQTREKFVIHDDKAVDLETGEVLLREGKSKEEWNEETGKWLAKPWTYFKEELEVRMGEDPKSILDADMNMQVKLDYPEWIYEKIHPIFVSRMPNHKVSGAIHEDTIRSPKHYEKEGIVLTKTPLTLLKLDKDNEIANYYNKESDLLLYNALKKQLLLYSGDAKKAFAEPFYKPKSDGTPGHVVKKVKLYDKMSLGVYVNNENGIAYNANGSMVRVDVFCEKGKYYFVPIYMSNVVEKRLPNKASVPNKPYAEWKEVKDEDFVFSLYPKDLIWFKGKKAKNATCIDGTKRAVEEGYVYYIKAGISTASFTVRAHDSSYEFPSFGIQNLKELRKYQVDMLGNKWEVKNERRMGFQ